MLSEIVVMTLKKITSEVETKRGLLSIVWPQIRYNLTIYSNEAILAPIPQINKKKAKRAAWLKGKKTVSFNGCKTRNF